MQELQMPLLQKKQEKQSCCAMMHRWLPVQSKEKSAQKQAENRALREELQECQMDMKKNELLFNLETNPDLLEAHIFERQALACRYRYLLGRAREQGLRVWAQF